LENPLANNIFRSVYKVVVTWASDWFHRHPPFFHFSKIFYL
jgi:hypothetical protein